MWNIRAVPLASHRFFAGGQPNDASSSAVHHSIVVESSCAAIWWGGTLKPRPLSEIHELLSAVRVGAVA
jgi:hypothetical protein